MMEYEYDGAHYQTLILPNEKIDIFPGEGVQKIPIQVGDWITLEGHNRTYNVISINHKMLRISERIFRPIVTEIKCDSY